MYTIAIDSDGWYYMLHVYLYAAKPDILEASMEHCLHAFWSFLDNITILIS